MFLNFGRFFGFGFQSKFDNLIKQDNLTIETILNEEDILSELKNQSSGKFADFIIANPQEYKKMIDYVIAEVEQDSQDMVRYSRYPFLISEILGSENEKLINFFFEKPEQASQEDIQNPLEETEPETQIEDPKPNENELLRANLLEDLLKLLDRDAILITTAGYFTKIIAAIIHKRGYDFWEQLKHQPEVITNMFKHASTKHITEIFEKLIILDTSQEESEEHAYLEERKALTIRILRFLNGKKYSILIVQNICEVFIELYRRALLSLETMITLREILLQLVNPSFFMNLALQTQCSTVYSLLNIQFEFYTKLESLEEGKYEINFATLYKPVIEQVSKALDQSDCFKAAFRNSYNETLVPLGDTKLLLIQLFISLVRRQELHPFLLSGKPFQQIIDLVQQHPSNNQLHVLFEKLVVTVLEIQSSHIKGLLFEETHIFEFLIKWNGAEERKQKHGYQGILTKITNLFIANLSQSEELQKGITVFAEEWDNYVKSLSEVNEKEQQWILGINPKYREQQVNVESLSPPLQIPEPLVSYPPINQEIRKTTSLEIVESKPVESEEISVEFQEPQQQTVVNQEVVVENLNNSDSDKEIQHQEDQQPVEGEGDNTEQSGPQEEYQVKEEDLDQPEVEAEPRVEREILPSPITVNQQQEFFDLQTENTDQQINNEPESQEKIEKEQEQLLQKEQPEQQEQEQVQQQDQQNENVEKVNQDEEMREPEPQEQQLQQQNEIKEEPQAEPNTESQEQQNQEEKSES